MRVRWEGDGDGKFLRPRDQYSEGFFLFGDGIGMSCHFFFLRFFLGGVDEMRESKCIQTFDICEIYMYDILRSAYIVHISS